VSLWDDKCICNVSQRLGGKWPLVMPRYDWKDNIERDLKEILCQDMKSIHLIQDTVQCRHVWTLYWVSGYYKDGNFLTRWTITIFTNPLLHENCHFFSIKILSRVSLYSILFYSFSIAYRFSTTSNGSELSLRWSSSGN